MSGNFIQRGEPALINKQARAEIAINNGVDLVIELPHPYAMSGAETFASGAVKILHSLGVVDCISFGSEHGEISSLEHIADILVNEPEKYKTELKAQLDTGLSYAVCRQNALKKYLETASPQKFDPRISELLETSNNILGIEYLKAIKRLQSPIKACTVKRVSNGYNTPQLTGEISSATAIRNSILSQDKTANAYDSVPGSAKDIIGKEFSEGRGPNGIRAYENIIFSMLRQMKPEQIRNIPDVTEGLEYRIKSAGENSGTIEELIANICTRRYPQTRIRRILFSVLTGVSKTDMELFARYGGPQYARILGFNQTGRELLSKMKKSSALPVITKLADYKHSGGPLSRMIEIESLSTDMYVLAYKNPAFRQAGQEFTQNVVILK